MTREARNIRIGERAAIGPRRRSRALQASVMIIWSREQWRASPSEFREADNPAEFPL